MISLLVLSSVCFIARIAFAIAMASIGSSGLCRRSTNRVVPCVGLLVPLARFFVATISVSAIRVDSENPTWFLPGVLPGL